MNLLNSGPILAAIGLFLTGCVAQFETEAGDLEPSYGEALQGLGSAFDIVLWPDGVIPYWFDDGSLPNSTGAITATSKSQIQLSMTIWEIATAGQIDFRLCSRSGGSPACPASATEYLTIRYNYNDGTESGHGCTVGMGPDSDSPSHIAPWLRCRFVGGGVNLGGSTSLHELGHVIGLGHEQDRLDADRWLLETAFGQGQMHGSSAAKIPVLGNFDYDSAMHYASRDTQNVLRWTDDLSDEFSRFESDSISAHDTSRVLQYYAREYQPAWDFFESLSVLPANGESKSTPTLANGIDAVGTPGIAKLDDGTIHLFARGSNDNLYWKTGTAPGVWTSLGCCIGSDPSAARTKSNQVMVAFVGASSGKLIRSWKTGANAWSSWYYVEGGYPTGGIETDTNGYVGPAIASRGTDQMDFFVVRADGRLASVSYDGSAWGSWTTHGNGYAITARPSAASLSPAVVRLAVTAGTALYEPSVTFNGATVTGFTLGVSTATVATGTPPAISKRDDQATPYRVLAVNGFHRVMHKFASGSWRDIGGIPLGGTGISAVQTSAFGADLVINGVEARACDMTCPGELNQGAIVQAGGLWVRHFF